MDTRLPIHLQRDSQLANEVRLKQIIQDNESRLKGIVNSLVHDATETQDLVQETFLELLENFEVNDVIENVSAWLVTVAKNKVLDRFRRRRTQTQYLENSENLISPQPDPELESWTQELRESLILALRALPEDQRDVFIWHELEGKSFEEISKNTGVGINTLLSRKRYAVQFLREYLQEVKYGTE